MQQDVLIVGNGVAGYACASRLARQGFHPMLVGQGLPYDRPPLTKGALAAGTSQPLATTDSLAAQGIELIDGVATEVNLYERRAVIDCDTVTRSVEAASIVLAVGLEYGPPPVPGLEHAHVNATPAGYESLVRALDGGQRTVAVIGAGLIGVETAATLARLGHHVTVFDIEARPLHRLHEPLPALAASALHDQGVEFRGDAHLLRASADPSGTRLEFDSGATFEADVVIAATGGRARRLALVPALEFPLAVDDSMRVIGIDGVYAIGDCAIPTHARFGILRFPHWDAAHGMAERAAESIAGKAGAYERLPYWWSDIGDLQIGEVGYADAVAAWEESDGLHVGRDGDGEVVCVLVVGSMGRMRDARALLAQPSKSAEAPAPAVTLSFARDIRHLFREDDRVAMEYAFDLWLYEDVRDWAPRILERIEDGSMPCDAEWPQEQLERFRTWIDAGCKP